MTLDNLPELLTVKEVASIFRLCTRTLKIWERKGILVPIRVNSRKDRRYRSVDIINYINKASVS